ncbi:putative signal peptide-containing protein [Cryptosporidium canis]|nr:putative signal peptide-containing protein [Cryptosporidium canis]
MKPKTRTHLFFFIFVIVSGIYCSTLTKIAEPDVNNDESKAPSSFTTDSELVSSEEVSNVTEDQSIIKNASSLRDQSLYVNDQIAQFDDATGYLGLIAVITNKRQSCRIISGNFYRQNEAKNTLYLFFDTVNKSFVGIFVPKLIQFTLKGKLGLVTLVHKDEVFLLNKLLLINSNGEISPTNSPWKLIIEVNSDYNKLQIFPFELRNKNYIMMPPDGWDSNTDSMYPNNIKGIKPLSILTKSMTQARELRIPHFSVGTSPTALFLKLNTGEYMSIIVPNNTVFFVDIDDCSIHSRDGHYYNVCGGYSVYSSRWFLTNRPWGTRIIIQSDLDNLLEITKSKLQALNDVTRVSTPVRGNEKSSKFKLPTGCWKHNCCRR